MKAVAFNGSPRVGGNTEFLLKTVLEQISAAGHETEFVQVGGKLLHGCTACLKCRENKNRLCVITNDIVNDCIAKMIEADAILLGSPAYFADMTPEMKALIDRAGYVCSGNGRLLKHKIGAAVVAARRGGATHVLDSINHFFLVSQMIVPGSTYWNFGIGREKGQAANDSEGVANMQDLGQTIAWLMSRL
ncbi:MAG TPA: flavodoxin family protein [Phycisphaerae bacterium]|nr:flavodoxin family protein [Phycisphaerae bacterium]HPS53484.1 flavodoxin family protein [Phycisphaerae bacterium]